MAGSGSLDEERRQRELAGIGSAHVYCHAYPDCRAPSVLSCAARRSWFVRSFWAHCASGSGSLPVPARRPAPVKGTVRRQQTGQRLTNDEASKSLRLQDALGTGTTGAPDPRVGEGQRLRPNGRGMSVLSPRSEKSMQAFCY